MIIRIATRQSPLALWQSHHVSDLLRAAQPGLKVELVSLETYADQRLDIPISGLGGKGAFSKEVQARVLVGDADIAVHSAKDLQAITPEGLRIGAFPERGDVRDALVGNTLSGLPLGATVATGSNRRQVLLGQLRPDLKFVGLRGNIGTRLAKASEFDAIVMAAAALRRLDERPETVDILEPDVYIPQVGQGALAIECRNDDEAVLGLLAKIDHARTRLEVEVERSFLAELGGDCDLPAAAHCSPDSAKDGGYILRSMLADLDRNRVEQDERPVPLGDHHSAGADAARFLRTKLAS